MLFSFEEIFRIYTGTQIDSFKIVYEYDNSEITELNIYSVIINVVH